MTIMSPSIARRRPITTLGMLESGRGECRAAWP
jgi:hypothetical protein